MIRVMVVDDHELVREGITRLLDDTNGITVVATADCGEDAVGKARDLRPDVVLMDVKMPGMGGLEATRRLLHGSPESKVVALTVLGDDPYPSRLLQAGARGYVTKDAGLGEVVDAIMAVQRGRTYLAAEVARDLAMKQIDKVQETPWDGLTEREMQILLMIVDGRKVQEVSDRLCLSPKTVNGYRYKLFEKLHVKNDVELTRLAIRHGLIGTEEASA